MILQREPDNLVFDGPASPADLLASDADRDAVAGILSSAFAEGRLTSSEHAGRIRDAYEARTRSELARLTADLPDPDADGRGKKAVLVPDGVDRCLLCAVLICCPPAGIAWLLRARRRARADGGVGAEDR
jgi:hypothetical protein